MISCVHQYSCFLFRHSFSWQRSIAEPPQKLWRFHYQPFSSFNYCNAFRQCQHWIPLPAQMFRLSVYVEFSRIPAPRNWSLSSVSTRFIHHVEDDILVIVGRKVINHPPPFDARKQLSVTNVTSGIYSPVYPGLLSVVTCPIFATARLSLVVISSNSHSRLFVVFMIHLMACVDILS